MSLWKTLTMGFFKVVEGKNHFAADHPDLPNTLVLATLLPLATIARINENKTKSASHETLFDTLCTYQQTYNMLGSLTPYTHDAVNITDSASHLLQTSITSLDELVHNAQTMVEHYVPNIVYRCRHFVGP